ERIGEVVVRGLIVKSEIKVVAAAATPATTAAPTLTQSARSERVDDPHVDVLVLAGRRSYVVKILRSPGFVGQRNELQQFLRRVGNHAAGNRVVQERQPGRRINYCD